MSEFRDFFLDVRNAQSELATKCAAEIMRAIPAEIKSMVQKDGLELMRLHVEQNALRFIRGYTAWLASHIMRSGNFAKQAVPVCDHKTARALCRGYDVEYGFASSFVKRLVQPGMVIPVAGRIYLDGEIIPDETALTEWAHFLKKTKPLQP